VIYFVRFEHRGRWKIGYTEHDAASRTTGLTFTPCEFWVEAEIPGPPELEAEIHRRFASQRVPLPGRKEIFETSQELENFVAYAREFGTVDGFDAATRGDFAPLAARVHDGSVCWDRIDLPTELAQQARAAVTDFASPAAAPLRASLLSRIEAAWSRAEEAFGYEPLRELRLQHGMREYVTQAPDVQWAPGLGVYEIPSRGAEETLRYLLEAPRRHPSGFALAWVAVAAEEQERGAERRNRHHVEYLPELPEVARQILGRFPAYHHASSQLFPLGTYGLLGEPGTWPLQLEGFVRLCRVHADACLRHFTARRLYPEEAFSDVPRREARVA